LYPGGVWPLVEAEVMKRERDTEALMKMGRRGRMRGLRSTRKGAEDIRSLDKEREAYDEMLWDKVSYFRICLSDVLIRDTGLLSIPWNEIHRHAAERESKN
jgi:hypothetical protein